LEFLLLALGFSMSLFPILTLNFKKCPGVQLHVHWKGYLKQSGRTDVTCQMLWEELNQFPQTTVIILGGLKLEIFRRVTPSSEGEIESNMN
jgi:hypothetical protein